MNSRWTVRWLEDQDPVVVEDAVALDDALASAELDSATTPLIVELRSPSGSSLTVGLGRGVSVATFAASAEPPYFVSDGSTKQDAPMVFFREGHWSEFDGGAAIAPSVAREAVHEFFATGTRPSCVVWREV
jgi:Immunity protein Imm1